MLGRGMGMIARAELTVNSRLVVAFIAVTPVMLAVFNLVYRIYPSWGEVVGMLIGLAGVLMLTQGEGYRASPVGLLEVAIAELGWSLGSALSQRRLTLAPGAMGFATEMLCGGILLGVAVGGEHIAAWEWTSAGVVLCGVTLLLFGRQLQRPSSVRQHTVR